VIVTHLRICQVLALLGMAVGPSIAAAQRAAQPIPSAAWRWERISRRDGPMSAPPLLVQARTHWLEGGIIGGTAAGLLGAVVGHDLCPLGDSHNCTGQTIGLGLLGAGVGFITGALIGGLFPKD